MTKPIAPSVPLLTAFYTAHGNGGEPVYFAGQQLETPAFACYESLKAQTDVTTGQPFQSPELDAEAAAVNQYAADCDAWGKVHGGDQNAPQDAPVPAPIEVAPAPEAPAPTPAVTEATHAAVPVEHLSAIRELALRIERGFEVAKEDILAAIRRL